MPCPLFEPREKKFHSELPSFRLPLLDEFSGICHSSHVNSPQQTNFHFCNHGYANGQCSNFPKEVSLSALRFNVIARTNESVRLLIIEEENHWPRAFVQVEYKIGENRLVPEMEDICRRAQIAAFCKSYLERFCGTAQEVVAAAATL